LSDTTLRLQKNVSPIISNSSSESTLSYNRKEMPRYCIVVDLDYTLVNVDTTAMCVEYACPLKYKFLHYILFLFVLKFFIPLLNRIVKRDVYKLLLTRTCLKNCEMLDEIAEKVYFDSLKVFNIHIFKAALSTNAMKILLTASIDSIAKKFYDLGFDMVISSNIKCRNGELHELIDLYGKKHIILQQLLKYCDKILVIEDNPEPQYRTLKDIKVIEARSYGRKGS